MNLPRDPHLDVGAYLLGVLDPAEEAGFQQHLASCPECARQLDELGELKPVLDELAPLAAERPSPQLLDRLVAQVATVRHRSRVRRLVLAAAAALLVLGGPAVTAVLTQTSSQVAVAAQQFAATSPTTGVSATVGVTPVQWGSRISLSLTHLSGPLSCDLVAVSHSGERQTVTSWSVPAGGYGGYSVRTTGGAGMQPGAIDHFEVRTLDGGDLLVSVPTSHSG